MERDFLPRFAKVSPVNIPTLVTSSNDYIAYRKITGDRFSPENFFLFSTNQKVKLFKLLGEFITCLHNFEFTHQYLSEAPYGVSDFWNDLWLPIKDYLSEETNSKAECYFSNALKEINAISFEKKLTHSDLGTNNILVNYDQCHFAGIIDFGNITIADPAVNFARFYRNFGRQFVEEVLNYYHRLISGRT